MLSGGGRIQCHRRLGVSQKTCWMDHVQVEMKYICIVSNTWIDKGDHWGKKGNHHEMPQAPHPAYIVNRRTQEKILDKSRYQTSTKITDESVPRIGFLRTYLCHKLGHKLHHCRIRPKLPNQHGHFLHRNASLVVSFENIMD